MAAALVAEKVIRDEGAEDFEGVRRSTAESKLVVDPRRG